MNIEKIKGLLREYIESTDEPYVSYSKHNNMIAMGSETFEGRTYLPADLESVEEVIKDFNLTKLDSITGNWIHWYTKDQLISEVQSKLVAIDNTLDKLVAYFYNVNHCLTALKNLK